MRTALRRIPFTLLLLALACPLHADSGDLDAVRAQCGPPASESTSTNAITSQRQRNLTYGRTILHFAPDTSGWAFSSAWYANHPIGRASAESRLPCLRTALSAAASHPHIASAIDPSIQGVIARPETPGAHGLPSSNLLIGLGIIVLITLIIFLVVPRKTAALPAVPPRFRRRPKSRPL